MSKSKSINLPLHPIILEDVISITSNKLIHWEKLKSKTVLITGASGLIGSYLTYTLLHLNETRQMDLKVLALVRNRRKAEEQFATILERDDFMLLVQDVAKSFETSEKIDYIIHAASQTNPNGMMSNPVGTITANTVGTMNLLELARKHNSQFLYLSSREIYGNTNPDILTITEDEYGVYNHTLVRSCYPESKRMSETVCSAYNHQYGIQTRVARLSHVYGSDYNLGSGRVWGEFLANAVRGENIVLKSAGLAELAFMYVSDAVSGLFFVLLNSADMIYNISDSRSIVQVRELAELVSRLAPEKNLKPIFEISDEPKYSTSRVAFLDTSKIEKLGWKPEVQLFDGLKRTLTVFSDNIKKREGIEGS